MSASILDKATVAVKPELCKGCGLCIAACPVHVLSFHGHFNTKGYHFAMYSGEGCTGCGICYYACPEPEAILVWKKGALVPEGFQVRDYEASGVLPLEEAEA